MPTAESPLVLPSSLFRRLGSLLYDGLLVLALLFIATAILMPFRGGQFQSHEWGYGVYLLLVVFLFFAWFWTRDGQTLGMRAWKIRLVSSTGGLISWRQAGLRFVPGLLFIGLAKIGEALLPSAAKPIGLLCLGLFALDFCWALLDKEKRCLHDLIASTRMVHIKEAKPPAASSQ